MTTDTTEKTAAVVARLNEISDLVWYHEYQDCVHADVDINGVEHDIWFGHANETFGASVYGTEGEDFGYIETGLDFGDASVEDLAQMVVVKVKQYVHKQYLDAHHRKQILGEGN